LQPDCFDCEAGRRAIVGAKRCDWSEEENNPAMTSKVSLLPPEPVTIFCFLLSSAEKKVRKITAAYVFFLNLLGQVEIFFYNSE